MWTDGELVRAARTGDKAAFGVLIERYQAMVQRIAYRTIRHTEIARDLAQESLLQAYLSLDNLRLEDRFRSWLYGITLNVCRYYLRSQRMNPLSLESMLGGIHRDDGSTPEEIAERLELRRLVMNTVEHLSPANRAAVLLFYYEDFKLQEAADLLGISVTALKGRLHKARLHLRAQLEPIIQTREEKIMSEMVPVKIVDVIRREVNVEGGEPYTVYQLVLFDEAKRRAFAIWIGEVEALPIYVELKGFPHERPLTQQFIERLLNAAGATVNQVTITALKDDIYYATVSLTANGSTHEIDARPSDALALATRMKVPIYASEELLQQVSVNVPQAAVPTQRGVAEIQRRLQELDQSRQEHREHVQRDWSQSVERDKQAILKDAFGVEG